MSKFKLVTFILIAILASSVWMYPMSQREEKLELTNDNLAQLHTLLEKPKYSEEPGTSFNGVRPETDRLLAQSQLNDLIKRLIDGLPSRPSKGFVLSEFERTMAQNELFDTEDRERFLTYLEQIMDIVGIQSSDGLLNRWMYGPLLGPLADKEYKRPDE